VRIFISKDEDMAFELGHTGSDRLRDCAATEKCRLTHSFSHRHLRTIASKNRIKALRNDFLQNILGRRFVLKKRKIPLGLWQLHELAQRPHPLRPEDRLLS